jgi:ABC-2 type transport system ATP-binding protein
LSARADDAAAAVPTALQRLTAAGVPVATVTAARPSLDDVYLRYAGRRFAEANANEGGVR